VRIIGIQRLSSSTDIAERLNEDSNMEEYIWDESARPDVESSCAASVSRCDFKSVR